MQGILDFKIFFPPFKANQVENRNTVIKKFPEKPATHSHGRYIENNMLRKLKSIHYLTILNITIDKMFIYFLLVFIAYLYFLLIFF